MQVSVRTADRVVLQFGSSLGPLNGAVIEDASETTIDQIRGALAQVQGDGAVVLSADHTSVTVLPPSQAWLDAQQQQQAAEAEQSAAGSDLASQYAWAVSRLDDIVMNGGSYTTAQTRSAVLDLARILRKTIRLVKADLA